MILHDVAMLIQQAPTDSVAVDIGVAIGTILGAKLALVLGLVNKFLVTGVLKVLSLQDKLPSWVKAAVALAFAQLATVAAGFLSAHGMPLLSPDIASLPVFVTGLEVWAVSMGWHSLLTKLGLMKS